MLKTLAERFARHFQHAVRRPLQEKWYNRYQATLGRDLSFSEAARAYPDRNALHAYMHHYFRYLCPGEVRAHREYFRQDLRGFGEDAFHAMWWLLLREFKPGECLEIGVYRGQVISLWAVIAKLLGNTSSLHGISPFAAVGDSVGQYRSDIDYLTDTVHHFKRFNLSEPILIRSLSNDAKALEHIRGHAWDLVYIDGSHDYEVVLSDYRHCRDSLKAGGLLVLDDASAGTSFRPPLFSFAGHPGPSRVAAEVASKEMRLLGAVGHNNVFLKA